MKLTFKGNFGTLEMIVDSKGNAIGNYQKSAIIAGKYIDQNFSGEWSNKGMSGLVKFTVNDGALEGKWKKGTDEGPMKSKWIGKEVQPESYSDFEEPDFAEGQDALFDAAREIVLSEQRASASLLQRKLKLGYNRANRILDELENAGIIGPFEGKARVILEGSSSSNNQDLKTNTSENADHQGSVEESSTDLKKEIQSLLKLELKDLYDDDKWVEVITLFEENKADLEVDEDSVYNYLWSLWLSDGNEDKCNEMLGVYSQKINKNSWTKLKGHYASHMKWYDFALDHYRTCSERHYNATKKIFDDFSDLIEAEKWDEAIIYFEENLTLSVSENHLDVGYNYCRALYRSSGDTERKALERIKKYLDTYEHHKPFLNMAGDIAVWLGKSEHNFDILDEAASFYKKSGNKEGILAVKESIGKVKLAKKEKSAAEKVRVRSLAKQEAEAEKLKQHKFKSSKGETFCQFCAKDTDWSNYDCQGRKHGHNYVLMKVDGSFKPMCNKCGRDNWFSEYSCN